MNDCLCSWDSAWIFIISICFHLLKVIFLAHMYWAGKKSWVYKTLNKILNAEIIFMNGDINNLVIPVIVVVGDVLLLITIIEY